MKKWMVTLASMLALATVGCGGDEAEAPAGDSTAAAPAAPAGPPPIEPATCNGEEHSCVLTAAGNVLCAGRNVDGQLGDGSARDQHRWVAVSGLTEVTEITCGYRHTCARTRSGSVSCWGRNEHGQLGSGNTDPTLTPVAVSGLSDAVEVDAGYDFSCARRQSGGVVCWGQGSNGRLGNSRTDDSPTPVAVSALENAAEVSLGRAHACARRADGSLMCWGANGSKQLGLGAEGPRDSRVAVAVPNVTGAQHVAAGGNHTCYTTAAGAFCFGLNDNYQLGNGEGGDDAEEQGSPVAIAGLTGIQQLALGARRTCALLASGEVKCWGYNNYTAGLLGSGPTEGVRDIQAPTTVQGLTDAVRISTGPTTACAVRRSGGVSCWGQAGYGRLGDGETDSAQQAREVVPNLASLEPVATTRETFPAGDAERTYTPQIAVAQGHVCGVNPNGTVFCFGNGTGGKLGNASTRAIPSSETGTTVLGITDAVDVAIGGSGSSRTCAVRANGAIACWGSLAYNQATSVPVSVPGIDDAVEIAMGTGHTCVRTRAGGVRCWGTSNNYGQMGQGNTQRGVGETPVEVPGLTGVVQLVATGDTNCARLEDGSVKCWGSNYYGTAGTGSEESSVPSPTAVAGVSAATDISAGASNVCAVHSRGKVSCWGDNEDGEIGNGSAGREAENRVRAPFNVRSVRGAVRVGVGGDTVCVVDGRGEAVCWGANDFGQTGHEDAEVDDILSPTAVMRTKNEAVAAFGPYVEMTCSYNWCLARHRDGHLSFTGSAPVGGSSGFFGLSNSRSTVPAPVPGITWPEPEPAAE